MNTDFLLDKARVKQSFAAAASSYDAVAGLQRRIAGNLVMHFPLQPTTGVMLDLGAGTGYLSGLIGNTNSTELLLALDIALPMLMVARRYGSSDKKRWICADMEKLPLPANGIQQIYSSLAIQWCRDMPQLFAESRRVLANEGQLVFSTFGPSTLRELKAAWASVDGFKHVNEFYSEQQIHSCLHRAGFKAIDSIVELEVVGYPSVMALMRQLKALGAQNANQQRNRQLTGRHRLQQMISAYENSMETTSIIASFEVFYFKAIKC
jgi:malonyl-CoA O-methyltransferase